jgi:uncharacterized protein involved in exopolysaccharide biosynthesis
VLPEGASAYRIECVTSDAAAAALLANLAAAELVDQTAGGDDSPQAFGVRLAEAVRRVERSRQALEAFRTAAAKAGHEDSQSPDGVWLAQVHEATLALAAARARAEQPRDAGDAIGSSAGRSAAPAREELEQARITLARLRERYTDEHPDVERLVARVRELEDAARAPGPGGTQGDSTSVESEIAALTARLTALMKEPGGPSRSPGGKGAPPDRAQLLLSEYAAALTAYEALLERSRAAEAAARLGRASNVRFELLRAATVPDAPEPRGLWLLALLGGGIGLLVGVAAAVGAEMRDKTVRGPEDLAELGYFVLATIPLVRARASRKDH